MNTDCCNVNAAFECLNKTTGFQPSYAALKPTKNENKTCLLNVKMLLYRIANNHGEYLKETCEVGRHFLKY